jgi:hypothetical protein
MKKQTKSCVLMAIVVVVVGLASLASAVNRADSATGNRPQFLAPGYLVHKVHDGNSRFDSTICVGRPDGALVLVSNQVGNDDMTRSPTLVLCQDGQATPLGGDQQRPNFVVAPSASSEQVGKCPAGYEVANVYEAAMFLRENGLHFKDGDLQAGLSVAIMQLGINCDDNCEFEQTNRGDYNVLIANADKTNGRVYWDELGDSEFSGNNDVWDTLCISSASPIRFAPQREECPNNVDKRGGITFPNEMESSNGQKDQYCATTFGSAYAAADLISLSEAIVGSFSAHFIETYLAGRQDCCSGNQQYSPLAFFTARLDGVTAAGSFVPEIMFVPTAGIIADEDRRFPIDGSRFQTLEQLINEDCRDCDYDGLFDDAGLLVFKPEDFLDTCSPGCAGKKRRKDEDYCDAIDPCDEERRKRGEPCDDKKRDVGNDNEVSLSKRGGFGCDQHDNLYVGCARKVILANEV